LINSLKTLDFFVKFVIIFLIMKKYFLIIIILFIGCQKEVVQKTDVDRKSINSELFDMLNNNDSLRIHTFAEKLENFNINASEKNALRDCIALHQYKEKFIHDSIGRLSWNHIDYLYNNGFEDVSLYYARHKFNAELINKTLPNFLNKIDSALVMFSNLKSNCQYANLYQLKITYLMTKSYNNLALKEMQKILRDNEITENCPDIKFSVYMEMSFMYADLKLTDKSLESAYEALSYAEKASDKAISNSLIAKAYLGLNQTEKGLDFINEALALEVKDNFHMLNYYKAILMEIYVELGNYNKSDALFKEYESSVGFLNYHHYLFCRAKAKSLKKREMYAKSINYYIKAKSFIPEDKLIPKRIILKDLSDVYALNDNFKEAIFYLNEYQKREEQYTKQQNENLINEQTVALRVAENEAELLKTKKKTIEQDLIITKKNKTIVVGSIISVGLLLLILLFLIFYKRIQHKNLELASQKQKVEQANAALTLALEEKSLLMKEIHHRVKNHLQFLMCILRVQARANDISIEEFVDRSNARLTAIATIHQQLYEIQSDEKLSLKPYVVNLSSTLQNMREIACEFTIESDPEDIWLSNHLAVSVGLILNELISNSYKHAFQDQDNFIKIFMSAEEGRGTMVYRDSGKNSVHVDKLSKSSGIEIIKILAMQIHANITFNEYFNEVVFCFECK
jgi:two-component system, sensor histidine kinase PdtaS